MILLLLSLLLLLLLLLLVLSLSSYYPYPIIILLYNTFLISFPITFPLWNIHILSYPLGAYHLPHDCWTCVDVIYLFSGLTLPRPWSSFPCCSQKQCLANAESDTPTLSGITSQSVWKWGIPQKKMATLIGERDGKPANLVQSNWRHLTYLKLGVTIKIGYPPFFAEIQWHQGALKTLGHTSPSLKLHQELQWPASFVGTKRSKDVHYIKNVNIYHCII